MSQAVGLGVVDGALGGCVVSLSRKWFTRIVAKAGKSRQGRRRRPVWEPLEDRRLMAVSLQFDYSLDTTGFFTPERRTLLESTLNTIAARLGDTLTAVPSRAYTVPTSNGTIQVTTAVSAGVIKLYPFGDSLSGATTGHGAGYWTGGGPNAMRGQGTSDYAPNIGTIAFDADASTSWFFGSTTSGLASTQTDFVTAARHEFLHVLGMTPNQPTFTQYLHNSRFFGPSAKSVFHDSPVPMNGVHVADRATSLMNAASTPGTREDVRRLEWAFLDDIGWDVRPPYGFFRNWDLFTNGDGDGLTTAKIVPTQGVYLMEVDALAGDTLHLVTRNGAADDEKGVDSFLKIFNADGQVIANSNNSGAGNKEDFTMTFPNGGVFWVGVSTFGQRGYTFTTPSAATPPATAFYLDATLTGVPDAEPANINGATNPIVFTSGSYSKQTTLAGSDSDYYRIDAIAGHTYTITTSLPPAGGLSGQTVATVYDAAGQKIAGMDGSSRYGQTGFTAPASGPYYVMVKNIVGPDQVGLDDQDVPTTGSTTIGVRYVSNVARVGGGDYVLGVRDVPPPIHLGALPLFLDFGASGLWAWSVESGYVQLSPKDPQEIVSTGDSAYVDFGAGGLWRWSDGGAGFQPNDSSPFTRISAANPESIAPGVGSSLYIDFGPFGLWSWNGNALSRLSAANPEAVACAPDGSLYIDFGAFGFWQWTAAAGLKQLSKANPDGIVITRNGNGYDGSVYLDFGPSGVWRWSAARGFRQLIAADAQGLSAAPDGTLIIDFGAFGLWRWSTQEGVRQINNANPERIVAASDGWLYIDFGPSGLWRWSSGGGYQKLHPGNVQDFAIL